MLLPAYRSPLQKPLRGAGLLPIDPYLALYQQAVVLYSLRKTTPQATKAIRIRRDSDSVEQDIGFAGKDLNQQAIKDFGGYNLLGYTEDLTNSNSWFTFENGTENIESGLADPFGGNGAYRFSTAGGGKVLAQSLLRDVLIGDQFSGSLYYRNSTHLNNALRIFRSVGSGAGAVESSTVSMQPNTTEWQRIDATHSFQNSQIGVRFDVKIQSGSSVEIFAPQLTEGANLLPYQRRLQGGASDCTIVKWYDQINNNDSVQNNIALQPKIYDVESGEVTKENGKPAGILDGADDNIPILNVAGRSNIDVYFVNRHYLGNTIYPFGTNSIVGGTYGFVVQQNSSSTLITSNYGNPNLYKNKVLFAGTTRNNIYNFLGQTQNIVNHQGVNVSSWDTFHFGNFPSNQFRFEGTLQEIIVFADNLTTAERQILHDDINNYYAIY
jgi:hypothetical protein